MSCVMFLDDRYEFVYGAQENLLLLAEQCRRFGHRPIVASVAKGRLLSVAAERGLPTEVVEVTFSSAYPLPSRAAHLRLVWSIVTGGWSVARQIRAVGADVVVVSSMRAGVALWALAFSRKVDVVLYAQSSVSHGLGGALSAGIADVVALIGDGARSTFPQWSQRIFRRRFRLLPSGRQLERFAPDASARAASPTSPVTVVCVASLTRRKGIHLLVEAVAEIRRRQQHDVRLLLVGDEPHVDSQRYVADLKLAHPDHGDFVEFAGWHDDVVPLLRRSDIFALASFDEGVPGVLIEAMAAGLPCVTSEAGSAGDLVRECGGAAVPVGDVDQLAIEIERFVLDPALRRSTGDAARHRVAERYSVAAFGDRFEQLLQELSRGGRA